MALVVGERLAVAAEDRIRYRNAGRAGRGPGSGPLPAATQGAGFAAVVAKFVGLGLFVLILVLLGKLHVRQLVAMPGPPALERAQRPDRVRATVGVRQARNSGGAAALVVPPAHEAGIKLSQPTPAEREARRRRNEESMRILEESTPEM